MLFDTDRLRGGSVLIIDLLNIGDVLFITPAIRSLAQHLPSARIDVLVSRETCPILAHNPFIGNIMTFDKSDDSASQIIRIVGAIRASNYDIVLDFHGSARTSIIAIMSGAKRRAGFVSKGIEFAYHYPVKQRRDIHRVESYLEMLRELGVNNLHKDGMEMYVPESSRQSAREMWNSAIVNDKRPIVGLNTGARVSMRRWPVYRWVELVDLMHSQKMQPVLFGGPDDTERCKAISAGAQARPVSFAGKVDLPRLAAMISWCDVLVTTDTGPQHIAASQKTPIVLIPGHTIPRITGPYGTQYAVVNSSKPCAACGGKSKLPHTCLADTEPQEVIKAVTDLVTREPLPYQYYAPVKEQVR